LLAGIQLRESNIAGYVIKNLFLRNK
jgi:hypothetical protein